MAVTTMTKQGRILAAAAGVAGVILALSGCVGDSAPAVDGVEPSKETAATEAPAAAVYDFDDLTDNSGPFYAADQEVTVQLSDELAAAVPEGRTVAVQSYTLSAKVFDTGYCRLDVEIAYAGQGAEALSAPRENGRDSPQKRLVGALEGHTKDLEVVGTVPTDEEIEGGGKYITEDFSHLTLVKGCSGGVDDEMVTLKMPYDEIDEDRSGFQTFASVEVAVVPTGPTAADGQTIIVTGSTVAELSVTGEWSEPESSWAR